MSKILVLNGSPRKDGNTKLLAEAFAEGAKAAGNTATVIDVAFKNIAGYTETPVKDDMEEVYAAAREADALIIASPMYFYGLTGQLKCCYDRLHDLGDNHITKTGMLLCAADGSEEAFDGVVNIQKANAAFDNWEYVGEVRACSVAEPGDIKNTEFLEEAKAFAAKF